MGTYSVRVTTYIDFDVLVRFGYVLDMVEEFGDKFARNASSLMPGCSGYEAHVEEWSEDDERLLPDGSLRIPVWFEMSFDFQSVKDPRKAIRAVDDGIDEATRRQWSLEFEEYGELEVEARHDGGNTRVELAVRNGEELGARENKWDVMAYVSNKGLEPSGMWEDRISDVLEAAGLYDPRWTTYYSRSILDEAASIVEKEWY